MSSDVPSDRLECLELGRSQDLEANPSTFDNLSRLSLSFTPTRQPLLQSRR